MYEAGTKIWRIKGTARKGSGRSNKGKLQEVLGTNGNTRTLRGGIAVVKLTNKKRGNGKKKSFRGATLRMGGRGGLPKEHLLNKGGENAYNRRHQRPKRDVDPPPKMCERPREMRDVEGRFHVRQHQGSEGSW